MTSTDKKVLKNSSRPWAIAGTVVGLVVLMLALAGVFRPKVPSQVPAETSAVKLAGQETGEVKLVDLPRFESAVGTVKAVHEAAVASKLLARVLEVKITAGQPVEKGEELIRLDDADLQARFKQAEAAKVAAQAVVDQAVLDHERAATLIKQNAVSQAEYDKTTATLKTAQAELQRAQQLVQEAQVMLDFAVIRSPLTGIVIDKKVEPGDTAAPGQVLANLYEPEHMQLVATVRESLALRLKVGDEVPAKLDAIDHECLATVSEIVPEAEATSRSFTVKVTGPCPPGVYSGMFGRISIPLDKEELLVVPDSAVVRVGQLEMVDVVEGDEVRRRAVQLGRSVENGREVLAGLEAGDQVLLHSSRKDAS